MPYNSFAPTIPDRKGKTMYSGGGGVLYLGRTLKAVSGIVFASLVSEIEPLVAPRRGGSKRPRQSVLIQLM